MNKYDIIILILNLIKIMLGVTMTYYAAAIPNIALVIFSIAYTLWGVSILVKEIKQAGK